MHSLTHKIKVFLPMLLFFAVYMLSFCMLEKHKAAHYHYMYADVDRMIPFNELFIVPYVLWFLFIPAVVIYLLFKDEAEYRRASIMLIVGMSAFVIISALFPTKLYLRPMVMPRDNIFSDMVRILYSTDTSTNVFPSIHVYNTLVAIWAILHSRTRLFNISTVRACSGVLSVLIILATMFLKQHSIMDVIGAFLLFGIVRTAVVLKEHEHSLIPILGNRRS